jgi:enoyl-CoA hydratase/carnithine racemase
MGEEMVTTTRDGDVCIVRLQREAKLNALSEQMAAQLIAVLGSDDVTSSRVVVLAGSAKAFSAGADLTEFTDPSPEETIRYYRGPGRIWELLPELPQPSIAAISGWAIGGGLELALSADLRVADETARFGLPEVSLGILPSAGGMSRLVRLLGTARAKQLILLGERFDAARALELGVVNRVVPAGEAETAALEWARKLAEQPQAALQITRELIDRSAEMSLAGSLAAERLAQGMLAHSAAARPMPVPPPVTIATRLTGRPGSCRRCARACPVPAALPPAIRPATSPPTGRSARA